MDIKEKSLIFYQLMKSAYIKGEDREAISTIPVLGDATEDFIALLMATHTLYQKMTGDEETDLLGFTHILNRLAVMRSMEVEKQEGKK